MDLQEQAKSYSNFFKPDAPERAYLWARSLTYMREKMISECDIRITSGGKWTGYAGVMPGILEEVLIAIRMKKPLYLLGGFGGITKKICQAIESSGDDKISFPEELTFSWQKNHVAGYDLLRNAYNNAGQPFAPYGLFRKMLTFDSLNNGLTEKENIQLFHAISFSEAINLILRGIRKLYSVNL